METIGINTTAALSFNDQRTGKDNVEALRVDPRILSASIYTNRGSLFASYRKHGVYAAPPDPGGACEIFEKDSLLLARDIYWDGQPLGRIVVRADLRDFEGRLLHYAALSLVMLLVSLIVGFALSRHFSASAILGLTSLALDAVLPEEAREPLHLVNLCAQNLAGVLNDILDFSKSEAGQMTLENIPFRLAASVGRLLKTLSLRAHEKGLELICDIEPDVPEGLLGDPTRLQQILTNLVGNAIKFTDSSKVFVPIGGLHS